jgi:phosphate transport system substrate-binding protein
MRKLTVVARFAVLALTGCGAVVAADLPAYQPSQTITGEIRSWGNDHMAALLQRWQQGFRRYHPQARFADTLKGTASAQWGLQARVADIALMGREIWPYEQYGTYRRSYNFAVGVAVATGSYDAIGKSPALAVFVHQDNPLAQLNLEQIDRIFGAERTGGWQGLDWVKEGVARDASTNVRTWGQLGLKGSWANKTIIPYGPPSLGAGIVTYFQTRVSGGAGTRNERLREYDDRRAMLQALAKDRYGIAYAPASYANPGVKMIALADGSTSNHVMPSRTTVQDRSYPLTRSAYIYFTVDTETGDVANPPVDPKVKEFLRYILSRDGQQDVLAEGDYLPLTPTVVAEQLARVADPPTGRVFRKDRRQ